MRRRFSACVAAGTIDKGAPIHAHTPTTPRLYIQPEVWCRHVMGMFGRFLTVFFCLHCISVIHKKSFKYVDFCGDGKQIDER